MPATLSLWQGRRSSEGKSAIMGMPRFFSLLAESIRTPDG
ncbi:DUF1845 family protein [Klebsiella pneumoniae]|nr:DUF1845 family protein [Klebsiella pneumoniae]